tara:strand:+ start:124 stop:1329 length:1206 start_codon:yes stop_codon:yes gene_type:complete
MLNIKKLIKVDIIFFLGLFVFNFFSYIYIPDFFYKFINGWTFNEWLINYQGGFVRRGLLGELIFNLNKINIDHRFIIFFLGLGSLFHITLNILFLIADKNIFYRVFILFNPFGLFYLVQNLEFFFARRDLFYLNFLIYFGKKKAFNHTLFLLFSIFLVLNYGIYIFLIGPIYFLLKDKRNFDIKKFLYSFILLIAPLNILLLTIFSNARNFETLCSSINFLNKDIPLQEKNCWGAPNWVDSSYEPTTRAFEEIAQGINYFNSFSTWLIVFIFLILCIFITTENNKKFTLKQIIYLSPYFFFFFFAQDWGRWIFLIFFIIFLNYSYSNVPSQDKVKISYLCLAPILLNIFLNVPTHLFQDILILDIRPIGFILSSLFTYFYNLIIGPYIIIRYGYNPPIILQ